MCDTEYPSRAPFRADPTVVPEKKQTRKCPQTIMGCPQKQIIKFLSVTRKAGVGCAWACVRAACPAVTDPLPSPYRHRWGLRTFSPPPHPHTHNFSERRFSIHRSLPQGKNINIFAPALPFGKPNALFGRVTKCRVSRAVPGSKAATWAGGAELVQPCHCLVCSSVGRSPSLVLCFSAASGSKGWEKEMLISSELQYFALSNPIQVVTVAKRKNRPTCRMDKNRDYYPHE